MSINLEDATAQLRRQLLQGDYPPGSKLREISIAEKLAVSRTIARLAMGALEHEGLLVREPNRGSRTRAFSINEIADAIEVRGELEAMAVRLAAERGLSALMASQLSALLEDAERLLEQGVATDDQRAQWVKMNVNFHAGLVEASKNWAVRMSIAQISNLPLVDTTAIIFETVDLDLGWRQLQASHADHRSILSAVVNRQGHRAETLMREHAFTNSQNKRTNLANPGTLALARRLPGGALIVAGDKAPSMPRLKRVMRKDKDELNSPAFAADINREP